MLFTAIELYTDSTSYEGELILNSTKFSKVAAVQLFKHSL